MEKITREQFDALKVGDELKNENYTLLVEAKFVNTILVMDNEHDAAYLSFKELNEQGYSINQHNCGFPYGDYSDKEVIVKVSDASIKDCERMMHYTRLINVSEHGFKDSIGSTWRFAVLVTNNVALIKL